MSRPHARLLAPVGAVAVALSYVALPAAAHTAERTAHPALVPAVGAIGMTVVDADRATAFFTTVLSFEKVSDVEVAGDAYEHLEGVFGLRMRVVRLRLGSETIELTEYLAPPGRPPPTDARSQDRSFQHIAIVVSDMDRAYARVRAHRVRQVSSEPQRLPDWNPNAAGIRAFYFKDPDGHVLELLQFPPGKGDPRWQRNDALFLGIDHTAIVVGDTGASLRFYRDELGLRVAGESDNYGREQEHLNSVFGAHLRITSLRAGAGPGIELLEYLAPRDGRPYPADEHANDLVHWQTELLMADLPRAVESLHAAHVVFVSPSVVTLPDDALGLAHALTVRDPDGHVMQLIAPTRTKP